MKAGIVLDDWKLAIFKRHLDAAGYTYEQHPGVTGDTITLTVITDEQAAMLVDVVKAANDEAARFKENKRLEN